MLPPPPITGPHAASRSQRTGPPGQVFFRVLPGLLTLAGLVLILYGASQYAWMYIEQQRFSQELQTQAPQRENTIAPQLKANGATLARLIIPKIHLDIAVVQGTSRKALLVGPGHLISTPLPGDKGNVVLAGHRDTFFRHLGDLSRGDPITLESGGKQYRYQVTATKIVEPTDTEVLNSTSAYQLTLITCYPFHYLGPAPQRFIVFAQLTNSEPQNSRSPANSAQSAGR